MHERPVLSSHFWTGGGGGGGGVLNADFGWAIKYCGGGVDGGQGLRRGGYEAGDVQGDSRRWTKYEEDVGIDLFPRDDSCA